MGRRSDIDWNAVSLDFSMGVLSVRAIAKKHGIAESNLRSRSKREGWTRAGAEATRRATDTAMAIITTARAEQIGAQIGAEQARKLESAIEEAAYDATSVVQDHQRQARKVLEIAAAILGELQDGWNSKDVQEALAALATVDAARAATLERSLGLKGKVEVLDRVAGVMSKAVAIERQAHGVDKASERGSEIDELLKRVHHDRLARAAQ